MKQKFLVAQELWPFLINAYVCSHGKGDFQLLLMGSCGSEHTQGAINATPVFDSRISTYILDMFI